MTPKNSYKPIPVGTRFTKLVVGTFQGFNLRRHAMFEVQCDCGTVKTVAGGALRAGEIKSCGCLPAERMAGLSSSLAEDHSGKQFGKLKVLRRTTQRSSSGSFLYECECECGKRCFVGTHLLTGGSRTSCKAWACRDDFSAVLKELEQPSPDPIKDAYFAGHFDGEGCVTFCGENYFPHLTIRVGICYKPTLLEYQAAFGGTIKRINPRNTPERRNCRVQWIWQVSAQHEVLRFICRILPYSSEKLSQLELAKSYMLRRMKFEKYNTSQEFIGEIPAIKSKLSELKRFEFAN